LPCFNTNKKVAIMVKTWPSWFLGISIIHMEAAMEQDQKQQQVRKKTKTKKKTNWKTKTNKINM